jgi:hypothetical protein
MLIRVREERGAAMILALLVTVVVLALSIVIVNLTIHSSTSSAYDRRRTIAVAAAEAGVDDYYRYLADFRTVSSTLTLTTIDCARSGSVTTGPNQGTFSTTLILYWSDPTTGNLVPGSPDPITGILCRRPANLPANLVPVAARITSVGRSPSNTLLRKMESFVRISPVYGGFSAAMLATTPTTIGNKVTINGLEGNDGDIVVSCPSPPCSLSLSNNQVIAGNLHVNGSLSMTNSVHVLGDVWTTGSVTMSTGATVDGNVASSQGSISVTNPALIGGNASAAGTVGDTSRINGLSSPGTALDDPPTTTLPQITFNATEQAAWQAQGYKINTYTDCTSAYNFIRNIPTTPDPSTGTMDYVVYINSATNCGGLGLVFDNLGANNPIRLPGSLAIITTGSITTKNQVNWLAVNQNDARFEQTGADAQLFLIDVYRTGLLCVGGLYDITTSNNTNFLNVSQRPILSVSLYSPCSVNLSNQNNFNGQVLSNTLNVQNQITMNYQPVLVPGVSQVTGFKQDVQFKREIS